jgi:hypothetical protein
VTESAVAVVEDARRLFAVRQGCLA